ncbi:flagellar biosynthetic protein FliQ [Roseomonas sp. OT10]|uniref:flagellar biosynthetic protein FliQ n=1 Tax=Roseomonas cutis TaxID=2897332 RepID=UPI001E3AD95D|nr:flagellar biosynthetic protein FliQ [Roseomonas sp. OT10]UFN48615.1 flagellar biosynthetic protein FliQ [Roseomonas sp. OT10]
MESDVLGGALRESMWLAVQLAGPLLGAMLVVGLAVSLLQALTQVQEASLAFLPKVAVCGGALLLLSPFMAGALRAYASGLFDRMVALGGAP